MGRQNENCFCQFLSVEPLNTDLWRLVTCANGRYKQALLFNLSLEKRLP